MKTQKAILYIRVSTDEQAEKGNSLAYQDERLRQYCNLHNIEVVAFFKEDYSAKTFERPEFKKLLEFIRKNKQLANLLLFLKWDRFSRNAGDAYAMIKQLKQWQVEPQSIEQPLDMRIPEHKFMLAIYLAAPEVENDRRALNTKDGMYKAIKDGRWMGIAPKGYKNTVDENLKPKIVPGKDADKVRWAFEQMATGLYHIDEVRKMVNKKGLKVSRNAFWCLLRNPVYVARMKVPAYKDQPAMIVKAKHEPLISDALFYEAQEVLDGKKRKDQPPTHGKREELPLRGFLACPGCGRNLTGSTAKGNGGRYFYYYCYNGCKERYRADEANKDFLKRLMEASNNKKVIRSFQEVLKDVLKKTAKEKAEKLLKLKEELETNQKRQQNAQTLMLDAQLDAMDYRNIKMKLEPEIVRLNKEIAILEYKGVDENEVKEFGFLFLDNLGNLFADSTLEERHRFLVSTFPEKLFYKNGEFQTMSKTDILSLISRSDKAFSEKEKGNKKNFRCLSQEVTPSGFKPETS